MATSWALVGTLGEERANLAASLAVMEQEVALAAGQGIEVDSAAAAADLARWTSLRVADWLEFEVGLPEYREALLRSAYGTWGPHPE